MRVSLALLTAAVAGVVAVIAPSASGADRLHRIPGSSVSFTLPGFWDAVDFRDTDAALQQFAAANQRYADTVASLRFGDDGRKLIAASAGAAAGLIVSIRPHKPTYTLKAHIRINLAGFPYKIYGRPDEIIQLPGGKAWRFRWSAPFGSGTGQILQYTFVDKGASIIFTYSTVKPYGRFADAFEQSARSIRIK